MYGPTKADLLAFALIFVCIGAATLKGCESGCSYVSNKAELKWKGGE